LPQTLVFDRSSRLLRGGEELGRVDPPTVSGYGRLIVPDREYEIAGASGWRFRVLDDGGRSVLELRPFQGRRGGRLRSPQGDRLLLRPNPFRAGRWSLAGAAGRMLLVRDSGWHPLGRVDQPEAAALHVEIPDEAMLVAELRIALTFACWLIALWESTPSPGDGGGGGG
jgi:hypothetical protein